MHPSGRVWHHFFSFLILCESRTLGVTAHPLIPSRFLCLGKNNPVVCLSMVWSRPHSVPPPNTWWFLVTFWATNCWAHSLGLLKTAGFQTCDPYHISWESFWHLYQCLQCQDTGELLRAGLEEWGTWPWCQNYPNISHVLSWGTVWKWQAGDQWWHSVYSNGMVNPLHNPSSSKIWVWMLFSSSTANQKCVVGYGPEVLKMLEDFSE